MHPDYGTTPHSKDNFLCHNELGILKFPSLIVATIELEGTNIGFILGAAFLDVQNKLWIHSILNSVSHNAPLVMLIGRIIGVQDNAVLWRNNA